MVALGLYEAFCVKTLRGAFAQTDLRQSELYSARLFR